MSDDATGGGDGVSSERVVTGHDWGFGYTDRVNVFADDKMGKVCLLAVESHLRPTGGGTMVHLVFSPASAEQLAHHILAAATEARGETGA